MSEVENVEVECKKKKKMHDTPQKKNTSYIQLIRTNSTHRRVSRLGIMVNYFLTSKHFVFKRTLTENKKYIYIYVTCRKKKKKNQCILRSERKN